ncbi:hypothetical protein ABW20_dc0101499 [Dactylellina cionopaga]|nr:hypothetical protein ABW20_dc0101499 [Dactylellina cionopaga]
MRKVLDASNELKIGVDEVKSMIDDIKAEQKKRRLEDETKEKLALYRDILQWLSGLDPEENLKRATRVRQDGTGKWLLDSDTLREFWDRKERLLWLNGKGEIPNF